MSDLAWMRGRLAELCGIKPELIGHVFSGPVFNFEGREWRPDEDVAQAVRVLTALDRPTQINNTNHDPRRWLVSIWRDADGCDAIDLEDASLSRAICLAVQKHMEWEP